VRLQYVSSHQLSVVNDNIASLVEQASIVSVSALTIAGSFHHSVAADALALFVIVAHVVAELSTCRSYVITQSIPSFTDTEENVSVGSINDSLGLQQLEYVKLYGDPKSVSIVSVIEIPVALDPALLRVMVYFMI
jgi:hypothetical protein